MVEDLSGVVEDGRDVADGGRGGRGGGGGNYLLQRKVLVRGAGEELVQVVDIGLEVLAVVESNGAGADHRLKGVSCVRELYKRKHSSMI